MQDLISGLQVLVFGSKYRQKQQERNGSTESIQGQMGNTKLFGKMKLFQRATRARYLKTNLPSLYKLMRNEFERAKRYRRNINRDGPRVIVNVYWIEKKSKEFKRPKREKEKITSAKNLDREREARRTSKRNIKKPIAVNERQSQPRTKSFETGNNADYPPGDPFDGVTEFLDYMSGKILADIEKKLQNKTSPDTKNGSSARKPLKNVSKRNPVPINSAIGKTGHGDFAKQRKIDEVEFSAPTKAHGHVVPKSNLTKVSPDNRAIRKQTSDSLSAVSKNNKNGISTGSNFKHSKVLMREQTPINYTESVNLRVNINPNIRNSQKVLRKSETGKTNTHVAKNMTSDNLKELGRRKHSESPFDSATNMPNFGSEIGKGQYSEPDSTMKNKSVKMIKTGGNKSAKYKTTERNRNELDADRITSHRDIIQTNNGPKSGMPKYVRNRNDHQNNLTFSKKYSGTVLPVGEKVNIESWKNKGSRGIGYQLIATDDQLPEMGNNATGMESSGSNLVDSNGSLIETSFEQFNNLFSAVGKENIQIKQPDTNYMNDTRSDLGGLSERWNPRITKSRIPVPDRNPQRMRQGADISSNSVKVVPRQARGAQATPIVSPLITYKPRAAVTQAPTGYVKITNNQPQTKVYPPGQRGAYVALIGVNPQYRVQPPGAAGAYPVIVTNVPPQKVYPPGAPGQHPNLVGIKPNQKVTQFSGKAPVTIVGNKPNQNVNGAFRNKVKPILGNPPQIAVTQFSGKAPNPIVTNKPGQQVTQFSGKAANPIVGNKPIQSVNGINHPVIIGNKPVSGVPNSTSLPNGTGNPSQVGGNGGPQWNHIKYWRYIMERKCGKERAYQAYEECNMGLDAQGRLTNANVPEFQECVERKCASCVLRPSLRLIIVMMMTITIVKFVNSLAGFEE
ncbi:uncharacterized protein LOC142353553 isoform X2 [Convolutriloba macropyga]